MSQSLKRAYMPASTPAHPRGSLRGPPTGQGRATALARRLPGPHPPRRPSLPGQHRARGLDPDPARHGTAVEAATRAAPAMATTMPVESAASRSTVAREPSESHQARDRGKTSPAHAQQDEATSAPRLAEPPLLQSLPAAMSSSRGVQAHSAPHPRSRIRHPG